MSSIFNVRHLTLSKDQRYPVQLAAGRPSCVCAPKIYLVNYPNGIRIGVTKSSAAVRCRGNTRKNNPRISDNRHLHNQLLQLIFCWRHHLFGSMRNCKQSHSTVHVDPGRLNFSPLKLVLRDWQVRRVFDFQLKNFEIVLQENFKLRPIGQNRARSPRAIFQFLQPAHYAYGATMTAVLCDHCGTRRNTLAII